MSLIEMTEIKMCSPLGFKEPLSASALRLTLNNKHETLSFWFLLALCLQ